MGQSEALHDSLFGSTRIVCAAFVYFRSIVLVPSFPAHWSVSFHMNKSFLCLFLFYFLFLLNRFDGLVDTTAGFNTTGGCWTTSSRRKMRFRCPSTITCSSYSPTIITAINAPSFSTSSSSTYAQFFMPHTSAIFNSFFFLSLFRLRTHTHNHTQITGCSIIIV